MFEGKNALTVAGELAYIPGPKPFNFPEIIETNSDNIRTRAKPDMLFCSGLSPKRVVQCLTQVCPSICIDGYLVHMDYQVKTFKIHLLK